MEFKFKADQISHTLVVTCHHCKTKVWVGSDACGEDGHHSLVTHERV